MCDVDGTLRALQHERRRQALDCVRTHRSIALADLAELVLERETGTDATEHAPQCVSRVYFSLYHTHLPVLQDAALVRYEQDADLVGVREETAQSLRAAREALEALLRG